MLPPLVMHKEVRAHRAKLGRSLVPVLVLDYLRLVYEGPVVTQDFFSDVIHTGGHGYLKFTLTPTTDALRSGARRRPSAVRFASRLPTANRRC